MQGACQGSSKSLRGGRCQMKRSGCRLPRLQGLAISSSALPIQNCCNHEAYPCCVKQQSVTSRFRPCVTQEVKARVAAIGSLRVGAVDDGLQSCSLFYECVVQGTIQFPAQHAVIKKFCQCNSHTDKPHCSQDMQSTNE